MFCDRCQIFWDESKAKARVPQVVETCEDIRWVAHEVILHRSIGALKRSSDLRCRLCRIIFSTPTTHEHATLLKDHQEAIDVVLSIDPNKGPHPVLLAEFREGNGEGIRILGRMVASCSGLLADSEFTLFLKDVHQLISHQMTLPRLWNGARSCPTTIPAQMARFNLRHTG
jgi:hypothetical protein